MPHRDLGCFVYVCHVRVQHESSTVPRFLLICLGQFFSSLRVFHERAKKRPPDTGTARPKEKETHIPPPSITQCDDVTTTTPFLPTVISDVSSAHTYACQHCNHNHTVDRLVDYALNKPKSKCCSERTKPKERDGSVATRSANHRPDS